MDDYKTTKPEFSIALKLATVTDEKIKDFLDAADQLLDQIEKIDQMKFSDLISNHSKSTKPDTQSNLNYFFNHFLKIRLCNTIGSD